MRWSLLPRSFPTSILQDEREAEFQRTKEAVEKRRKDSKDMRKKQSQRFRKVTRRGQPVMKHRMAALLERIEKGQREDVTGAVDAVKADRRDKNPTSSE
jgi:rRNA processing